MTRTFAALGLDGLAPVALAALVGLGLVFAAGFSDAAVMHAAAHDTRHATGFPCH